MKTPQIARLSQGEPKPELHLTGIWANPTQREEILAAIQISKKFIDLATAIVPNEIAQCEARYRVLKVIHKAALESGLPDFEGFYGIDPSGQFIKG